MGLGAEALSTPSPIRPSYARNPIPGVKFKRYRTTRFDESSRAQPAASYEAVHLSAARARCRVLAFISTRESLPSASRSAVRRRLAHAADRDGVRRLRLPQGPPRQ